MRLLLAALLAIAPLSAPRAAPLLVPPAPAPEPLLQKAPIPPVATIADPTHGLAAAFGARPDIHSVEIAPGGRYFLYLSAMGPAGDAVVVGDLDGGAPPKPVATMNGGSLRPYRCDWAGDETILCLVYGTGTAEGKLAPFRRMIVLGRDGSHPRALERAGSGRETGYSTGDGRVIDTLADMPGSVLMTAYAPREDTRNTRIARETGGLQVVRVDLRTGARATVEPPNEDASFYMTDGHGNVRLLATQPAMPTGYTGRRINYLYRPKGERGWKQLATADALAPGQFEPLAFDETGDMLYALAPNEGRQALFKVALDGSGRRDLVYAHPHVDVDGVKQVGPYNRVVAAEYSDETRGLKTFDPAFEKLILQLGRALPGAPIVSVQSESRDGQRLIVFAGSDRDPGKYYLLDRATRKLTLITEVRPQLNSIALGEERAVSFLARDGTSVPAYLTLPPGKPAKNLPAIVLPHGGPASRDEWGFDWLPQFFAASGYAVIQPNYRGSAGYGEKWFKRNGFKDWQAAIGDVNDAAGWLAAQGIADKGRIAIFGWSYGGYAALQANVLDPGLYKAAIAVAPVTDFGMLRDRANDRSSAYVLERDYIGTGDHLIAGSPARQAARIKVPVLLFHGDRDTNVEIAQSRAMRDALLRANVEHQLIVYAGLDHQLDSSEARADMLSRSAALLARTLGDVSPAVAVAAPR